MSSETHHSFQVETADAGQRLDRYLVKYCPQISRSQAKALIEKGEVQVGGKSSKPAQVLKEGEQVHLRIPAPEPLEALPEAIPLNILHEDEDILVIDKGPGMVVHLGAGARHGTLVNALLHHVRGLSGIGGVERPGIVHRLDKGTSGLLVVAKNDIAHRGLSTQFKDRVVEKTYFAFVWGTPKKPSGKIDMPLGRSQKNRQKIATRGAKLRSALTHYKTLHSWGFISLLELKPETGRTHQLRVHLCEIGHPIVGDPLYGTDRTRSLAPNWRPILSGLKFQLLHAGKLSFRHPITGKSLSFEAPLREEMREIQRLLSKGPS